MKLTPREIAALSNEDLTLIKKLDVSDKSIDNVIGLEACSSLIRLDISSNALASVDAFAACTSLRWLNVSKNHQISSLAALKDLHQIEVLNASNCALEGKVAVGSLRNLKALILNNNSISLVGGLDKLCLLDTLVLSHNNITGSLHGWMAGLDNLKKLSLSNNNLQDLKGLPHLPALQELRVNHCSLSQLPKSLKASRRLKILEAGGNDITSLKDVQVIQELVYLEQLSFRGCPVAVDTRGVKMYQERIVEMVPRLRILDNKKVVLEDVDSLKEVIEDERTMMMKKKSIDIKDKLRSVSTDGVVVKEEMKSKKIEAVDDDEDDVVDFHTLTSKLSNDRKRKEMVHGENVTLVDSQRGGYVSVEKVKKGKKKDDMQRGVAAVQSMLKTQKDQLDHLDAWD